MKTRGNTFSLPYSVLRQYSVINNNGCLHLSRVNRHDNVLRGGWRKSRRDPRMYQEWFPNRNHSDLTMFASLYQRLREDGSLRPRCIGGRPRQTRSPAFEEEVLERVDNSPSTSTRAISHAMGSISLQCCESCKNKTSMHTTCGKYKDWGPMTSHLVFDFPSSFSNGAS